jgi:UDP-N-acetylglucosamine 2-epimerase (non-hydrolysing)
LRDNTERPETLEVGSNVLEAPALKKILEAAKISCSHKKSLINPFGNGTASKKIVNTLESELAN